MLYVIAAFTAILSYLTGSVNTSIILSKRIYGDDIRNSGSGNAGATNMLRTHGKGIAVLTLICDVLKGAVCVVLATWLDLLLTSRMAKAPVSPGERVYILNNLKYIAGICAVLGHDFPLYFGFRGGKGVATSLGVVLALNWKIGLIVLAIAVIVMATSRFVSLGSISAAGAYPFILFTFLIASGEKLEENIAYIAMSLLLAILLILKHHSNIKKLTNGTENRLFKKKEEKTDTYSEEEQEGDTK